MTLHTAGAPAPPMAVPCPPSPKGLRRRRKQAVPTKVGWAADVVAQAVAPDYLVDAVAARGER